MRRGSLGTINANGNKSISEQWRENIFDVLLSEEVSASNWRYWTEEESKYSKQKK